MLPILHTERLELAPLTASDVDAVHALWTQPGVRKYLWDDEIIDRETVTEIAEKNTALFASDGAGLWLARDPTGSDPVGFCGFWHFHEPPQLELLYGVADDHVGRGYASEMAARVLDYGFSDLGYSRIAGSTDVPNAASARVMEKLGMRHLKRETVKGLETVWYEIVREAWKGGG